MSRSIFFAFLVVTIDAMDAGLIFPVLPDLLGEIFDIQTDSNQVTLYGGLLSFIFAACMFLFGPILGSLSDRFGRQRIIFIAMMTMVVDYVIMALTPVFWVLLIGRVMTGAAGGSYTAAFAIVADVSSPEARGRNFGLVSAGLGLGFILGPLIVWVLDHILPGGVDVRLMFWMAAGLALLAAVLSLVMFQESLLTDARRTFSWAEANALSVFIRVAQNRRIRGFLIALLIFGVGETVYETIWHFYGTKGLGWDRSDIALSLFVFGFGMMAVQGGLSGPLIGRFGALRVSIAAMALSCLGLLGMGFVWATWQVYVLMPLIWVSGLSLPGVQTYLTGQTSEDRQGELQGIFASLGAVALVLTPLYANQTLALATPEDGNLFFPGAPFLVAFGFCLIAWGLIVRAAARASAQSASE